MKHVRSSKFESEELPLRVNMRGRCIDGEWPILSNVNATVLTGEDPSPNSIISGSSSIVDQSWIQQLIIGGLPGVVYELWVAIRTNLGNVYIDTVPLAIIPDEAEPPPP